MTLLILIIPNTVPLVILAMMVFMPVKPYEP